MDSVVYFASDSHFGAGSPEDQRRRTRRFLHWLASLEDATHLYLLGDIFDFWLDYPTFMPKTHLEILYGLRKLQDRGVELRFVGGNHDVWCADYLERSLGIPALSNGTVVEHQGVRLRLDHGDGLLGGDRFYRLFRAVVRNRAAVFVAKSLHPEILHRLALGISHASRQNDRHGAEQIREKIHRYGNAHDHGDVDHLVVGHIHLPHQESFGDWTFTCLGDWIVHCSYGRLVDGRLQVLSADPA